MVGAFELVHHLAERFSELPDLVCPFIRNWRIELAAAQFIGGYCQLAQALADLVRYTQTDDDDDQDCQAATNQGEGAGQIVGFLDRLAAFSGFVGFMSERLVDGFDKTGFSRP